MEDDIRTYQDGEELHLTYRRIFNEYMKFVERAFGTDAALRQRIQDINGLYDVLLDAAARGKRLYDMSQAVRQ